MNIAMGSVLKIWHDYRTEGLDMPEKAALPPLEMLEAAAQHTDINQVIVDEKEMTVYLADPEMRLDVGGIAKGFATEIVAEEIMAAGLNQALLAVKGNIRVIGVPYDGVREQHRYSKSDESIAQ